MEKYDVAIVGAGPAGIACALTLAKKNLKIALIEKREFPLAKACGEGILPPGVHQLQELGILKYINNDQRHVIRGIQYSTPNSFAQASFMDGLGLGINRTILSHALYNAAQEYNNIQLIKADFYSHKNSIINFKGHIPIKTGFLVGADGLRSSVRTSLGIALKKPYFRRWAMTAHMPMRPWSSLVEIHLNNFVEAYITPTGPEEINVVLMWTPTHQTPAKGQELFFALLKNFPDLKSRLLQLSHKAHAIGPFHYRARTLFAGTHAALIGDAAGYIDPLTGEGINIGLFQGQLLGHIIGDKLMKKKAIELSDLRSFEQQALHYGQPHAMLTYAMLILQKQPHLFEHALKFFKRHPPLLSALTAMSMGIPFSSLVKRAALSSLLFNWHNHIKL